MFVAHFIRVFLVAICISGTCSVSLAQAVDSSEAQHHAVKRALGYVANAGESWIKKRGCVSCHQIPTMVWSHQLAGKIGDDQISDKVATWTHWSTQVVNFVKPSEKPDVEVASAMSANIDTMVALLLAVPQRSKQEWREPFVKKLCEEQAADGSWKACGQLPAQRRPVDETTAVTTLWTTYALTKHGADFPRQKAIALADRIDKAVSAEWYAVRLLVAGQDDEAATQSSRKLLVSHQNEDGGWGWRVGEPSDALGTGYALYALAVDGVAVQAIASASAYLVQTQEKSGKWIVPGTKKSAKGKPTATANDWGTAWAAIALLQSGL
jgi:squalene-hopene/tetraprenyl-beta-curcumene cyclase